MSQLQSNITLPIPESINGFITDASVTDIVASIENNLDIFGDAIGNLYGQGDYQYSLPKLINSLSQSIGSEIHDPAIPFGQQIQNATESFVLNGSKEAVLSLNYVNLVSLEGFDSGNTSVGTYTVTSDPTTMTDFEVFIVDRLLFFKNPPFAFTIEYEGVFPSTVYGMQGYKPNIIPNPLSPSFQKPVLTNSSGRIRVSVGNANYIDIANSFNNTYDVALDSYLSQFIDGSGSTPCPKEYISAYLIGGTVTKINAENIYIIDEKTFEIDTQDPINISTSIIIISISNTSIKQWIYYLVRELHNHKHDGSDISSSLSHGKLTGVIPSSTNDDINYSKSVIPNNEHVNYLHREGYTEDPGSYNNAMLGDLLISSTDPDNLFNNTNSDSNKIIFGEANGGGHSIYRDSDKESLQFTSASNGIRISYEFNNGNKKAIAISNGATEHYIGNDSISNSLVLASSSDDILFAKYDSLNNEYDMQNIIFNKATCSTVLFEDIEVSKDTNSLVFTSLNPLANIKTAMPFLIVDSNKDSGVTFVDLLNNKYANIFAAANDGTKATLLDNKLVVKSKGDVFFLKDTTAISNVITHDKAKIYAGDSLFYTVGTTKSTDTIKNGISFGEDHWIYMTSQGVNPGNILVIEANNKVIFAKPNIAIEVDAPTYTDIHANDIVSHGKIIGDITTENGIIDSLTVNNALVCTNNSTATFNGEVFFNESITFNDDVGINVLNVTTTGNFNGQLNANSADIQNLTGSVSTSLRGQIEFSPHTTNPSSFVCNVPSTFNQATTFTGTPTFNTPINIDSSTITTLVSTNLTSAVATITSASIGTLTITNVLNTVGINTPTLDTDNDGIVVNGRIQQIGSSLPNIMQAKLNIAGGIDITATGQSIKMNNGFIENMEMKPVPADKDVANVKFVRDEIAATSLSALLEATYPVGTVYTNTVNPDNPGTSSGPFGVNYFGSWSAYAPGRVIVGHGTTTDARSETLTMANAATGGEFKHVTSIQEMPAHSHTYTRLGPSGASKNGGFHAVYQTASTVATSVVGGDGVTVGSVTPHNNMQPYVVARMWVRTA